MASTHIDDRSLTISLTRGEKIAALHGDITVGRDRIESVEPLPAPVDAPRGLRSPGLAIPGRVKIGVWRAREGRRFVVARRDIPGVRLRLRDHRYREILLSIPDESERERLLGLAPVAA